MIKLPKEIIKSRFVYRQYVREGKYAIYEQILKESLCPVQSNVSIGWEVIIIKRQKAYERFGNKYPAKEMYPSNEDWGLRGFTFNNFRDANAKYKQLRNIPEFTVE